MSFDRVFAEVEALTPAERDERRDRLDGAVAEYDLDGWGIVQQHIKAWEDAGYRVEHLRIIGRGGSTLRIFC